MTPDAGASADAGVTLGVDIGGTKVLGVALDATDTIVAEALIPTPAPVPASAPDATGQHEDAGVAVAHAIADVVAQLEVLVGLSPGSPAGPSAPAASPAPASPAASPAPASPAASPAPASPAASPAPAPLAVGIGAPGMLDRQGRLRFSPNLPQAHGVDWAVLMADRLPGRRIVIENDANFAVLAEHRLGAARRYQHVVMVTLGTGIGGGVIVDGKVQVGAHGFAGEIGHMVVDPAGPPCPCGRRGCWERFASGGGLGLLAREAALAGTLPGVVARAGGDPEAVRGEDVTAAALAGDPGARRVIEQVGWWVGFGLANLACVLDPECFVLGGGLIGAGDLLLDATRRAFAELVEGGATRPATAIVPARLGARAGAVGAAVAARQGGFG